MSQRQLPIFIKIKSVFVQQKHGMRKYYPPNLIGPNGYIS